MLFAREMDYPQEELHLTPRQRFSAFFDAYQQQRPLCATEAALWPSLYQAMDAFWFMRVRYGADSLEMQLAERPDMPLDAWMEDVQARLHDVSIVV
jgi:Ser/Thr protein kinase RdoA (MazF antagonist)